MARIEKPANFDDLLQRYIAREPLKELAREAGVSAPLFYKWTREAGVRRPKSPPIPNFAAIAERYAAGEPEYLLARECGVQRSTLRLNLVAAGIPIRSTREAAKALWASRDSDARRRQTAAANDAARGRRASIAEKTKRAATRERTIGAGPVAASEIALADMLRGLGLEITSQLAVGPYNVDIAVNEPPIAVECFGGGWHASGSHAAGHAERTKYLLDRGWSVVIVWVGKGRKSLNVAAAEYVSTLAKRIRAYPAVRCQYRVILGNGETAPPRSSYLNTRAIVERLYGPSEIA